MRRLLSKLVAAYRAAMLERETRRMLHGLSDRMLHDLGLRRDEIDLARRRREG